MGYSIAIDGPAGAGKSTIAKRIAKQLGFIYVDTGAMYRAMALHILQKGVSPETEGAISEACKDAEISISYEEGEQVVWLNGKNVSSLIRAEEVGNMASVSSVNKDVRAKLVSLQQKLAETADVVMDGRDIGTCVLPKADVKVYLTASSEVRAKRRYEELAAKKEECSLEQILQDIIERDERDMNREISPLKQAEDAVLLDSSQLTIEEVVKQIISMVKK